MFHNNFHGGLGACVDSRLLRGPALGLVDPFLQFFPSVWWITLQYSLPRPLSCLVTIVFVNNIPPVLERTSGWCTFSPINISPWFSFCWNYRITSLNALQCSSGGLLKSSPIFPVMYARSGRVLFARYLRSPTSWINVSCNCRVGTSALCLGSTRSSLLYVVERGFACFMLSLASVVFTNPGWPRFILP